MTVRTLTNDVAVLYFGDIATKLSSPITKLLSFAHEQHCNSHGYPVELTIRLAKPEFRNIVTNVKFKLVTQPLLSLETERMFFKFKPQVVSREIQEQAVAALLSANCRRIQSYDHVKTWHSL